MTPLEKFLHDIHEIHSSRAGVDETSILRVAGNSFQRKRQKVSNPASGASFTSGIEGRVSLTAAYLPPSSSKRNPSMSRSKARLPSRGAIEVKSPREDATPKWRSGTR